MAARVAQEVIAYCSQCKMDLAAVIVAMKGDQIVRVECKTCRKERAYKAPKGVTDPGAAPAKKTTRGARTETGERVDTSIAAEWKKIMQAHVQTPAQAYSAKGKFAVGDKVKHPTFGEGIVMKHIFPNKMELIFEMDLKILICGGPREV